VTIINCEQGTEEWLKLRLGKFGGTDAQAVATNGKGLETLCFQKVADLIVGQPEETYTNEHMERGALLESSARLLYELKTGGQVQQVGYCQLNDYVGCSPDGLVGANGLIEIKCPMARVFVKFMYGGEVEKAYEWQMQHNIYVTERDWCDYVLYNESLDKIEIRRIDRDEKMIDKIKIGLDAGIAKVKDIQERINARQNN